MQNSVLKYYSKFVNISHRLHSLRLSCNSNTHFQKDLLEMLLKRHYLSSLNKKNKYDIGLLGKEVVSNWRSEWWRCTVAGNSHVVGIEEKQVCQNHLDDKEICEKVIFKHLIKKKTKLTNDLPVGVAVNIVQEDVGHHDQNDNLILALFVKKSSSDLEFETLHYEKTKWMKKYLRKPAQVVSHWGAKNNSSTTSKRDISAHYNHNESHVVVQQSSLFHPDHLRTFKYWDDLTNEASHSLVLIKLNLPGLLTMALTDSYHIIDFPNYHHRLLRIHPYLAPVKTAVLVEGDHLDSLNQLENTCIMKATTPEYRKTYLWQMMHRTVDESLTLELVDMIRCMNVSCWNADEMGLNFSDLDECGVVHTVVVSEGTLDDGILLVRNRDNSLKMQVHISELENHLFLYLNPR